MVDRERAGQYLEGLDRLLEDWKELAKLSSPVRLRKDRAFSQRACFVALASIQTALDLAHLIIAESRFPRPASYRESFEILEREGIIRGRTGAARLMELAGFRNRLAHQYIRLDWAKVHANLRRGAPVLTRFRQDAARWAARR